MANLYPEITDWLESLSQFPAFYECLIFDEHTHSPIDVLEIRNVGQARIEIRVDTGGDNVDK